jgi:O-antigen/teichoic acid export membrane protein
VAVPPVRTVGSVAEILRRRLRSQWSAGATTLAASAYSAGALCVVGLAASVTQTAEMASADRLYRVGLTVVIVLSSAFQAWVVHPDPLVQRSRRRQALGVHAAVGIVGAGVCAAVAPLAARLLFGSDLDFDHWVSTGYGLAFLMVATGTSLAQHVLVPDGQVTSTLVATVVGAVVGVPLLLGLSAAHGAAGGAFALAASELVVLICLAWRVRSRSGARLGQDVS